MVIYLLTIFNLHGHLLIRLCFISSFITFLPTLLLKVTIYSLTILCSMILINFIHILNLIIYVCLIFGLSSLQAYNLHQCPHLHVKAFNYFFIEFFADIVAFSQIQPMKVKLANHNNKSPHALLYFRHLYIHLTKVYFIF